jgi:hypothetical protein
MKYFILGSLLASLVFTSIDPTSVGSLAVTGTANITGTTTQTGVKTYAAQPILSSLTASRLVTADGSKGPISNGALTTNTLPKSASSGATLSNSSLTDDGTTLNTTETVTYTTGNGSTIIYGHSSESITLSLASAVTSSSGNLYPAAAWIDGTTCRVTTAVLTATTLCGSKNLRTPDHCLASFTTVTANSTSLPSDEGDAIADDPAFHFNISALKLDLETDLIATAGVVRCTVFWHKFSPPTS